MRAGVFFPGPWHQFFATKYVGNIADALTRAGHDVQLLAVDPDHRGDERAAMRASAAQAADPKWWRSLRLDVAVVTAFLGEVDVLRAAKQSVRRVVALADTDGTLVVGYHVRSTLPIAVATTPRVELPRELKHYATRVRQRRAEAAQLAASVETADVTYVEGRVAHENIVESLRRSGRPDLVEKVCWWEQSTAACFRTGELGARDVDVTMVGRWSSPQKRVGLLQATLVRVAATRPGLTAAAAGADWPSNPRVAGIVTDYGRLDPTELAALLRRSRIVLFASWWEGFPHASVEALASGATVVGPPIPAFRHLAERGAGRVSARRTPASLARALIEELNAWDSGKRDPASIATEWRQLTDRANTVADLIG